MGLKLIPMKKQAVAARYAKFGIEGTSMLAFREADELIRRYCKGTQALDFGCGAGRSTQFIKSLGFEVTGADISKALLKEARRLDPETAYLEIRKGQIPVEQKTYDLVFSSFVFLCMESLEMMIDALKEIARIMKDDGIFILINATQHMHSPSNAWTSYNTDFPENLTAHEGDKIKLELKDVGVILDEYRWNEASYEEAIASSPLEIVEKRYPMAEEGDDYSIESSEWTDSPFVIFVLRKVFSSN